MNNTAKHTPGPWHIGMKPCPMVYGPQGEQVVPINIMLDMSEVTANAAHIVHCVNNHDALLQALKALVREIDLSKLNVRKDFSLLNAHAYATKTLAQAEGK